MRGPGISTPWGAAARIQRLRRLADQHRLPRPRLHVRPQPLAGALIEGGVCGFKVHEDIGAHTRALDSALTAAEEYDVQVALYTDGLNECLAVEDTLAVLDGRTIHAFHIEGCGGGHVPNAMRMAGESNVIASSTNPTHSPSAATRSTSTST